MFSLSFGAVEGRSLLDRFILANTADKLVDDFDFLGHAEPSFDFPGDRDAAPSLLVLGAATLFSRLLDGDDGGD